MHDDIRFPCTGKWTNQGTSPLLNILDCRPVVRISLHIIQNALGNPAFPGLESETWATRLYRVPSFKGSVTEWL